MVGDIPAAFTFTRHDGVVVDVDCCSCGRCKNYFWTQHSQAVFERPSYCPYCGLKFEAIVPVGDTDIQIL